VLAEEPSRRRCCWMEVMTRLVRWPVGLGRGCASSSSGLARAKARSRLPRGWGSSSQASLSPSAQASLPAESCLAPLRRLVEWLAQRTRPQVPAGKKHRHGHRITIRPGLRAPRRGTPLSMRSARAQGQPQSTLTRDSHMLNHGRHEDSPRAVAGQPTLALDAYLDTAYRRLNVGFLSQSPVSVLAGLLVEVNFLPSLG
jgi:hypothetical protein